ncbi:MAG: Ubiquinone/menaquinone biosynthesis C-methyltransferase UbiE [Candidatus Thorarchaeota archaeon]|nr:MAG: Ubiquinone/menaquinone biosynthesis C-methyltransferase UbiE [Candidatus Thorarchaeota archaeon]
MFTMGDDRYYSEKLSADRLKRCYDIAPPRTRQYLEAELDYATSLLNENDIVLELGCGYGRILPRLAESGQSVVGIDTSYNSLLMAKNDYIGGKRINLLEANANLLPFRNASFDAVLVLQNGISAFKVNPLQLMTETIRVTRAGGLSIFSSYSPNFWDDRMEWFRLQSEEGLLGEIDWNLTKDGEIVCKDGFRATTFTKEDFLALTNSLETGNIEVTISEVDKSSIFCIILVL